MTLRVTDHAVLRYLERAGGFEIERLRQSIADLTAAAAASGAGAYRHDGIFFIIRRDECGPVVTTVLLAKEETRKRVRSMKADF